VAAGALYRPGPIEGGMVERLRRAQARRKKVEYPHPSLENILRDTYGVIVYQEQVMQISSALAGYSLGQARPSPPRHGQEEGRVMPRRRRPS